MRGFRIASAAVTEIGRFGPAAMIATARLAGGWFAWWRDNRWPLRNSDRVRLLAEISERKRVEEELRAVNRTLRTVNRCNEALVRATEELELVRSICQIMVNEGGIRMAWVGYRQDDALCSIRRVAHAGFEAGYLERIDLAWSASPVGSGPTGIAVRTAEPHCADDIRTDPAFEPWRDEAVSRGYSSSLALPLMSNGAVFGALTLYAGTAHTFTAQTRSHFIELANDLAYGVMAVRTRLDRARIEAELQRSEAYLEEGQKLTHTGSWAWDVRTRQNIYWSPEHFRIFGLDPAKDTGSFENALQQIHPEDRDSFAGVLDAAIREKLDFEVNWRILLPDGSMRFVSNVGHPVIDKTGEVVEFVGTLVDVTRQHWARMALEKENADRLRAEEELRRSEAFLAEGQRVSQTGSWAWNATRNEVSWSVEQFRIFGFDPDTVAPSYDLFIGRFHPEDRAALEHLLWKSVRDGTDFEHEGRIVLPGGVTKYVHSLGHCVSAGREDVEFTGTIMDITERRIGEEALRNAVADLERASRLTTMGQLTASIAHEINQPLSAIVTNGNTCLRWLEGDRPDLGEVRQAAKRIVRDGYRAGEIVKSIRAMARKSVPEMARLDVNDVIQEVIALMRTEFRRHDISIETELTADLAPVLADRIQLQQVILNLIMNGIEAMAEVANRPRLLAVRSATVEVGEVLVSIEDSGPGLDPMQAGRIFEPFFTTKREGMGMGLSICHSIIEAHGGRLRALPAVPRGSAFQFTLPAAEDGRQIGEPNEQ
jgi:PAS domain S-box-containing protein